MANDKLQWIYRLREFVFGMQDGIISTVGFLSGVQGAITDQRIVLISGVAQILTGALSMGIGSYLSTEAEKEVFDRIRKEGPAGQEPYVAQEELLEAFQQDGLSREEGYRIVSILRRNTEAFRKTFYEKVLGIGTAEFSKPLQAAAVMYLSFIVGGTFPIFPYFLLTGNAALIFSILLSCIALFATGVFKGVLVRRSPWKAGFRFLLVAIVSALAGYAVGLLLGVKV